MLWTIMAVLVLLWLVGMFAGVGNMVHILLAVALVVFIIKLLTGRRTI